ncbi:MAG TPA: uridine kinase [Mycobacteriales bacterium]|nr:uridine kinase [Mycobacteriales bacterium]
MTSIVRDLADLVGALCADHDRVTVAIDGPDAAGKTTLAKDLAHEIRGHVVRASVDAFLHDASIRYRRGELSPEGCYRDSFDYARLQREVLQPFARGGDRAVLLVDGVFLLRPELRGAWTLSVYLDVSAGESLRRAKRRDAERFGVELERRYAERYLPAQDLYRAEADPVAVADVVLGYDDPARPDVRRWPAPIDRPAPG